MAQGAGITFDVIPAFIAGIQNAVATNAREAASGKSEAPYASPGTAKLSGRAVVYLICSMAKDELTSVRGILPIRRL